MLIALLAALAHAEPSVAAAVDAAVRATGAVTVIAARDERVPAALAEAPELRARLKELAPGELATNLLIREGAGCALMVEVAGSRWWLTPYGWCGPVTEGDLFAATAGLSPADPAAELRADWMPDPPPRAAPASPPSVAAEPAQPDPIIVGSPRHNYRRGTRWAYAGLVLGGAGIVQIQQGAVLLSSSEGRVVEEVASGLVGGALIAQGVFIAEAGLPLVAGGSLWAARELREAGQPAGRGWGYAAWGLWGGANLTLLSGAAHDPWNDRFIALSGAMLVGAYGAGVGQMVANASHKPSRWAAASAPAAVDLALAPTEDGALLVLSGAF